jgi:hypothetical protein
MELAATFVINCSQTTCAKDSKKCCMFYRTRNFGTQPHCVFFREDLFSDDNYRPLRCEECLNSFKGNPDINDTDEDGNILITIR